MSWLRLTDLWDGFLEFIDGYTTSLVDIHEEPGERELMADMDSKGKYDTPIHANPAYNAHVDKHGREIPPHKHK